MALQYRLGMTGASEATAQSLNEVMNDFLLRSPGTYHYYNLAKYHFIASVYARDFELAEQILATGFAENHPYWLDDIAAVRTLLSPWRQHPLVEEYLNRIELDRQRARTLLGLN